MNDGCNEVDVVPLCISTEFLSEKQNPRYLNWILINSRWYVFLIVYLPVWFLETSVPRDHPNFNMIGETKGKGQSDMDVAVIASPDLPIGDGIRGWCHPLTPATKVARNYHPFLHYLIRESHRLVQDEKKKRGLCRSCHKKSSYKCKAESCGEFCCLVNPDCIKKHWEKIFLNYDYLSCNSIPASCADVPIKPSLSVKDKNILA